MKKIILIGGGGNAQVTLSTIDDINQVKPTWEVIGFMDAQTTILNSSGLFLQIISNTLKIFKFQKHYKPLKIHLNS